MNGMNIYNDLTPTEFKLVVGFFASMDSTMAVAVSIRKIAQEMNFTEVTVIKALKDLEDKGVLMKEAASGGHAPNVYRVLIAPARLKSDCGLLKYQEAE